jgi:hypothetical protein
MREMNVGLRNTAVGYIALFNATDSGSGTPNDNTAVGYDALGDVTHGYSNTSVGSWAGNNVTTGYYNVYLGDNAGNSHSTGYRCIYLGRANDCSIGSSNNEIVIGAGLGAKGSETAYIGGTNGVYNEANQSTFQTTSDIRIKKNVIDNTSGLDKINQIRVRNFEYRTPDEIDYTEFVEGTNPKSIPINMEGVQLGVIAQEIEEVLPEVVKTQSTGVKTVDPDNLTWYLVNAVKELSAENTALKSRLDAAGL